MKLSADKIIKAALKSVDPYQLILDQISVDGESILIGNNLSVNMQSYKNIYVIGTGKGVAPMAAALEELLSDRLNRGMITVKYGHGLSLKNIEVLEAGHPIPDENTLNGTKKINFTIIFN